MQKRLFNLMLVLLLFGVSLNAQKSFEIKGLCIAAPAPADVNEFVTTIEKQLKPMGVNTLVLRVDYGYTYASHPELIDKNPLTKEDVKKIVNVCKINGIRVIPQVNLLGHQSWASTVGKLLEVYPHFDETPDIQLPADYKWPNEDGLYCKSYCPQHPDVHEIVFDVMEEITEAFESDAFHAGMDEVFYIGHDNCVRCKDDDPEALFAAEVTKISNQLAKSNKELWIWGDRLIDGRTTGIGEWEGSHNNTHNAIDMIPKNVVINDWHYEKAEATPVLFASKGFNVIACPWNKPEVAVKQVQMLRFLQENSSNSMIPRYKGMMQTYWGSARNFMNALNGTSDETKKDGAVECFKELVKVW